MKCPRCEQESPPHAEFCLECGTPFQQSGRAQPSYADLQRSLTESLEQQTATSEILRVISSSPTDIKPVFDALARSAVRFCGAYDATLFRVEGGAFRVVAHHGPIPFPLGARLPLERGYVNG